MSAVEMFQEAGVLLDLRAGSKDVVLETIIDHAVAVGVLPRRRRDEVVDALRLREERGSTGVGGGVAIPHAKIPGMRKSTGLIARAPEGVEFRAVDGERVYVIVLLISPESRAEEHLATLRWLSRIARDPDFVSFIRQAESTEEVMDVLHERA